MLQAPTAYKINLLCDHSQWWRYNIYIMVVCYDENGEQGAFNNLVDRVYDMDFGGSQRTAPKGSDKRKLEVLSDPCSYIKLYVYAIANTFPDSANIKDSPPFFATIQVSADDKVLLEQDYEVNQWGGMTIAGVKVAK